jgi:hypothetical protein
VVNKRGILVIGQRNNLDHELFCKNAKDLTENGSYFSDQFLYRISLNDQYCLHNHLTKEFQSESATYPIFLFLLFERH